jgi:hypothetical protein
MYHHPHHRDNVTASHGCPNHRSRLHFGPWYSRESNPDLMISGQKRWPLDHEAGPQNIKHTKNLGLWSSGIWCCTVWLVAPNVWRNQLPHPPSSVHSKQPSATLPRRISRYGHPKVEVTNCTPDDGNIWCPKHVEAIKLHILSHLVSSLPFN